MIYSNLLIFLTAIFLFSIAGVPAEPSVSLPESLLLTAAAFFGYGYLCSRLFRRPKAVSSVGYFATEKQLSIISLLFFAAILFLTDLKFYLRALLGGGVLPVLTNLAGLGLFLALLSLMWLAARKKYGLIFGKHYRRRQFVALNVRLNLPIVLPWLVLSLAYDLLALMPISRLRELLYSPWGDLSFFGLFLVFVMVFFPPLVRRLWGCRPLPEGPLKDHLSRFCRGQNFRAEIYIWPLFEGQVLTAGVMGLVPGLRYILLTPAIIQTMTISELEAVLAHEIGHVKKKHLLLYVLLIGGFSALAGLLAEPFLYYSFTFDWVFQLMTSEVASPETVIGLLGGVPLLVLLLLYFRYVFGYFIRNFERQADVYVFKVLGNSRALVSAFDKIAGTGTHDRDRPNWHHFGIGERVDYLERCERDRSWIVRQDRKVLFSLVAYIVALAVVLGLLRQVPTEQLVQEYEEKYIELVLMSKVENIADQALLYRSIGDLMFNRKMEQRALVAYQKAMELDPDNPELLNNLAWLLLTSSEAGLRQPEKALELAKRAAALNPQPHVLDTLATAYWANGYVEAAVAVGQEALRKATANQEFYRGQLERFRSETYGRQTPFIN